MQRDIDIARQIGIDRHIVVLAGKLHTEACEINDSHRVGTRGRYLPEKFANRFTQRCLIEIARARHREACGGERIGYQAGIIGGRRELG